MTPFPDLPPIGLDSTPAVVVAFILTLGIAALVTGVFGYILFRAGRLPHPAPLIVSLSLLTGIALIGGITTHSTEALTLAATGIGALAGSLSAIYNHPDDREGGKDESDTPDR